MARWERRLTAALPRLRQAGVEVIDGVEAGTAPYVRLRAEWNAPRVALGDFPAYTPQQIDVSIEQIDVSTERIADARSTP